MSDCQFVIICLSISVSTFFVCPCLSVCLSPSICFVCQSVCPIHFTGCLSNLIIQKAYTQFVCNMFYTISHVWVSIGIPNQNNIATILKQTHSQFLILFHANPSTQTVARLYLLEVIRATNRVLCLVECMDKMTFKSNQHALYVDTNALTLVMINDKSIRISTHLSSTFSSKSI